MEGKGVPGESYLRVDFRDEAYDEAGFAFNECCQQVGSCQGKKDGCLELMRAVLSSLLVKGS